MAFIDIARVNAYVTRKLAKESEKDKPKDPAEVRDPHRFFMLELVGDLLNQGWMHAMDSQTLVVGTTEGIAGSTPRKPPRTPKSSPSPQCAAYASKDVLALLGKTSRDARGCVVCKHEGRNPTTLTDYCKEHKACLCRKFYTRNDEKNKGFYLETSQESEDYNYEWSCWDKYHRYYVPKGLYNVNGNIIKHSKMHKESKQLKTDRAIKKQAEKLQLERARRVASLYPLPTLVEEAHDFGSASYADVEQRASPQRADLDDSVTLDSPVSDHEQDRSFVSLNSSFASHVSTDFC
jgi:hypothetical protein